MTNPDFLREALDKAHAPVTVTLERWEWGQVELGLESLQKRAEGTAKRSSGFSAPHDRKRHVERAQRLLDIRNAVTAQVKPTDEPVEAGETGV